MRLIDERVIYGIGNGTARIYGIDGGRFMVEVENNNGLASVEVSDETEAWRTWLHPFAAALEIPQPKAEAGHMERYHEMYAAIELAEAGDSDEV